MSENVVTLKSTHRGLIGRYVSAGLWTAFNLFWVMVFRTTIYLVFAMYNVSTIAEYWDKLGVDRNHNLVVFLATLGIALFALLAFVNICDIIGCFYREKTTLLVDKAGRLITKYRYSFPCDKDVSELSFDRVIKVDVSQGMFNRLTNTGDLAIKTLTYANADTIKTTRYISYVDNPYGAKERIKADLPEYTGLKVQVDKASDPE